MKTRMMNTGRKSTAGVCGRVLVTVTVLGSAGPLRFLVDEGEVTAGVVRTALKAYAREGRFPHLSSNTNDFLLYYANGGSDALSSEEKITFYGQRNFVLCKKESGETTPTAGCRKGNGIWLKVAGLNKLLSLKI